MSALILATKTDALNNLPSRVEVWFSKQHELCQVRGEQCTATPCFVLLKSTSSHYSSLSAWPRDLVLRHLQRCVFTFGQKLPSASHTTSQDSRLALKALQVMHFNFCVSPKEKQAHCVILEQSAVMTAPIPAANSASKTWIRRLVFL